MPVVFADAALAARLESITAAGNERIAKAAASPIDTNAIDLPFLITAPPVLVEGSTNPLRYSM
jgi:hypothetical protein